MPEIHDSFGNYVKTVLVPGTVGYPINTDDMDEDEIANLEPIEINEYDED